MKEGAGVRRPVFLINPRIYSRCKRISNLYTFSTISRIQHHNRNNSSKFRDRESSTLSIIELLMLQIEELFVGTGKVYCR